MKTTHPTLDRMDQEGFTWEEERQRKKLNRQSQLLGKILTSLKEQRSLLENAGLDYRSIPGARYMNSTTWSPSWLCW